MGSTRPPLAGAATATASTPAEIDAIRIFFMTLLCRNGPCRAAPYCRERPEWSRLDRWSKARYLERGVGGDARRSDAQPAPFRGRDVPACGDDRARGDPGDRAGTDRGARVGARRPRARAGDRHRADL